MELKNKRVVITGASTGIGFAIAEMFIENWAEVFVLGLHKPNLKCTFIQTDISNENQIIEALKQIDSFDILINNAGIWILNKVEKMNTEDLDSMININLKWPFLTCKYSIPKLKDWACIVNISSMLWHKASPSCSVYSMTKAWINLLTQTLALELAERKIRVNAIAPWWVNTPIWTKIFWDNAEEIVKEEVEDLPLKRLWNPKEIAHTAKYIVENDFITWSIVTVDWGESL